MPYCYETVPAGNGAAHLVEGKLEESESFVSMSNTFLPHSLLNIRQGGSLDLVLPETECFGAKPLVNMGLSFQLWCQDANISLVVSLWGHKKTWRQFSCELRVQSVRTNKGDWTSDPTCLYVNRNMQRLNTVRRWLSSFKFQADVYAFQSKWFISQGRPTSRLASQLIKFQRNVLVWGRGRHFKILVRYDQL